MLRIRYSIDGFGWCVVHALLPLSYIKTKRKKETHCVTRHPNGTALAIDASAESIIFVCATYETAS